MKFARTKSSRIVLTVSALCLFFLALIWVSFFRQRSFEKKDAIEFTIERNSNLAVALEQFTIRTLHVADAVLQIVKMQYALEGDSLDLQKLVTRTSLNHELINGIVIIGNDGRLKMANISYSGSAVPDFSASSFFIYHSRNDLDTLLISKPLVSKLTRKPAIVISRRLNDSRGRFEGVIALQLEPSMFTSFYAQAQLLPNDIISLVSPDGLTYARRTGTIESSGEDISKSPLFVHVADHADSFYYAKDAIRGIPTWFSYRKIQEYPIIATVGRSEQDILGSYVDRQSRFIVPRVITSILVILFSIFISFFMLHRRRLKDRLTKEEERFERLLTEQMIAVQEREREWIGRELHDNVNQVLTTVKLYLEMASKNGDDPLIPRSMQLINSSICEIRNLSHQLSAPTLGTGSLIDSINALIGMVELSNHLRFEFDHSRYSGQLMMNQKLALYRILQEQVNNVIKHAQANRVWISLYQKDGQVTLAVRDNGKGFDRQVKANGMGINNIISRAKIIGGTVRIDSFPRKGCCLVVSVPVSVRQQAETV